ncbi:MAG: hypothetical protein R2882_01760 [Gemmatimonadales bacterium]
MTSIDHRPEEEIRETFRDSRFRWAGGAVLLLLAAALLTSWRAGREVATERAAAAALARDHWLGQCQNPHSTLRHLRIPTNAALSFVDEGIGLHWRGGVSRGPCPRRLCQPSGGRDFPCSGSGA